MFIPQKLLKEFIRLVTSHQISGNSRHIPLYKHNSLKLKHLTEKLKVSKFHKFNHGWWRSSPVQGPSLVKVQGWRPHGKINIGCPSFSPLLISVTFCGIQFTREVCLSEEHSMVYMGHRENRSRRVPKYFPNFAQTVPYFFAAFICSQ